MERDEALLLIAQCIAPLPQMPKKVLALYYNEDFKLAEIAACLGLTEYEVDQLRAKTLAILETMLPTQLVIANIREKRGLN